MQSSPISRRRAMTTLAVGLIWPAFAQAQNAAQPPLRFRAVEVDVSAVKNNGDPTTADWIARDLPGFLKASLDGLLVPGDRNAPVLRARIDLVLLGLSTGGSPAAAQGMDQIEGAGLVVGANGRVIASYPLLSSVQVHPSTVDPDGFLLRQRVANLAQSFAQWLPGKLGV